MQPGQGYSPCPSRSESLKSTYFWLTVAAAALTPLFPRPASSFAAPGVGGTLTRCQHPETSRAPSRPIVPCVACDQLQLSYSLWFCACSSQRLWTAGGKGGARGGRGRGRAAGRRLLPGAAAMAQSRDPVPPCGYMIPPCC